MRVVLKSLTIVVVLLFVTSAFLTAQQAPSPEEQAAMMAKYQQAAIPGPEHKEMAELVGKWKYSLKMWMSPQIDNPMQAEGDAVNEMIIDGRFLQSKCTGMVMGQKFEGITIFGFDRRSGEYTSVGFDNTGTYSVSAKGKKNKETGEIQMTGEDYDAIGDFTQKYKFVMTINSKDSYSFSLFFTDPIMSQGTGEFKMVELQFTRVKE